MNLVFFKLVRSKTKFWQMLAHENHLTIHKLRFNQPLTAIDLSELERILLEAGVGTPRHGSRISHWVSDFRDFSDIRDGMVLR